MPLDDFNQIAYQMLLSDANLALTFVDMAASHRDPEAVKRSIRNAISAYNSIVVQRRSISMSDEDAAALDSKLKGIRKALIESGEFIE